MRASLRHKAQLFAQLHHGLKAGVPFERLLAADALPPPFAVHARRLARNVREGRPLHAGLRATAIIQPWEEQLLSIGDECGRLPTVLRDLADFHEARWRQMRTLRAKLVYPLLVMIAAIVLQPVPALANGLLSPGAYLAATTLKLLALYVIYRFLIARSFERAVAAAFSPLLLRVLAHLDDQHWLRQQYEVAYLDLLTLCLDCGLDVAETLRLLRDACNDAAYRQTHTLALQRVEIAGLSLAQVLIALGLIRNSTLQSFLSTSESSGTLHSDLRTFLVRKRLENAATFEHFVKKLALWLYAASLLFVLAGYL